MSKKQSTQKNGNAETQRIMKLQKSGKVEIPGSSKHRKGKPSRSSEKQATPE
jgi:ribosome-associated protein YbcJ (S4-like RNA binding protein)